MPAGLKGEDDQGFKRPRTGRDVDRKNSDLGDEVDDFETVADKPKKPAKVPFKRPPFAAEAID